MGMFPEKTSNFTVTEMPFPAFSTGHLQKINTKENAVRGQGRVFFTTLYITFLAVCLWINY